ncbi:MAG: aminodeoxychorismate/anthranilate synthase component II [Candidatus Omnitrophica bacterium]|nr:aminodeoxychorismate/anthranilate synthase component II [Candidatus Omnitrophota bacterium]
MILVIDNYDSFTYNLVQYLGELGEDPLVFRNDALTLNKIKKMKPRSIIISPGPGMPRDAGISNNVIKKFSGSIPILGVCLGHQCIGEVFGGKIKRAKYIMHGKTSFIHHTRKTIFKNVKNPFEATRYHSLIIERKSLPRTLEIIAETKKKEIMGIKHKKHPTWGVQFHPESILTSEGKKILKNFLEIKK